MKSVTMVFLALAIFCAHGCHKGGGGGGSSEAAAPNATTTEPTATKSDTAAVIEKDVDNGKPSFVMTGKSSLSLAGSAVEGVFFGQLKFDMLSYTDREPVTTVTEEGQSITVDSSFGVFELGNSQPLLDGNGNGNACQTNLLKKGSILNVPFCELDGTPYEFKLDKEYGEVSVDFLALTIKGLGVVANGVAYINSKAKAAHDDNVSVKDLPIQQVADSESNINIVYARKDWFPDSFTVEVDKDKNATFSIKLNATQTKTVNKYVALRADIAPYSMSFVPMEVSSMDLTGVYDPTAQNAHVIGDYNQGQNGPVTPPAGEERPDEQQQQTQQQQPQEAEIVYFPPVYGLTATPIPFGKSKFVMEINLDEVLSADSVLDGDNSSFKFQRVNGIPFGTTIKTGRKEIGN